MNPTQKRVIPPSPAARPARAAPPRPRSGGGALSDPVVPTATQALLAFSVEIRRRHVLGIVYFAAARCMETGITDSVNLQLSQTLKQQADAVFVS